MKLMHHVAKESPSPQPRSITIRILTRTAAFLAALCLSAVTGWIPSARAAVTPEDFGYASRVPRTNLQPLIVVLVRFDDTPTGPSVAETANWIFPDTPTNRTVNGFFAEMSANRFAFTNAGVVPIVESTNNRYEAMKLRVGETNFFDGIYLSNLYARAVQTNPAVFGVWDANRDNKLSEAEITILFVLNDGLGGAKRGMQEFTLGNRLGWAGGSVVASPTGAVTVISHELAHMLGAKDLYSIWGGDEEDMNPGLSLMAVGSSHLDAWHKMVFGWYRPRIFSLRSDGTTTLQAAQMRDPTAPIILYDETRGTDEYYLLEYRTPQCAFVPNTHYVHDNVPDRGLLIWHVRQETGHRLADYHEVVYPHAQGNWWQCKHCRALYRPHPDMVIPCPSTNGTHARFGDTDIHYLVTDVPSDPGEHDWRYCMKCTCLFFQPLNSQSACAAGGLHSAHSENYSLPKNVPGPLGHNDWARCLNCQVLFLWPNRATSVCPANGQTHVAAADRYTLIANDHLMLMSRGAPNLLYGTSPLWHGNTTTPHLTWYDGTTNRLRISVDSFSATANYIRVRWMTWDPTPLVVSHPASLPEGFNTFTVSATDGTNAVATATVNIQDSQGGEWEKTTAANGTATFSLSLLGPKTLQVTVTKERYITYAGTITVGTGYLAFDPIASPQLHGVSFPITLRARSTAGVVSNFTGTATLEAFRRGKPGSVLLTEFILGRSGAYWRGLQVQNVSAQGLATAGWRVVIGDNPTNINAINPTVKSLPNLSFGGAFLGWTDLSSTSPWGSPIGWAQNQPGWAMILDTNYAVVDFVAWGWDSQAIQTMAPVVNSHVISVASAWAGDGFPIPTGNLDVYRQGYEDQDVADDFSTGAINVANANPYVTLPFGSAEISLSLEPEITGHFTNGVWSGSVALLEVGDDVRLRAVAGPRQGESGSFDVQPTVLHHYAFAPISSPKIWNAPFAVTITAQDASSNTVISFNGQTRLYGFQSVATPSVVITEVNLGEPDLVEVQNVSTRNVNTTGWRLLVGDDALDINDVNRSVRPLPTSLAARQVYWAKDDASATNYWGGALNWSNSAPGWVMLLDAATNLVDFVVWGWSEEDIATMSPSYGRTRLPVTAQWAGAGIGLSNKRLPGSLQRRGNVDYSRSQDFAWSMFTSHGYQNSALTTPLAGAFAPIAILPESTGNFVNGLWTGNVTILEDATNVFLQALDSTGHRGESTQFEARYLGPLTVTLPATATEGDGVLTGQGVVQLPRLAKAFTTIFLTSSDTSEITVPASVSILGAQSSVSFNLTVVNDSLVDLGRTVTIRAAAAGYSTGEASMVVLDNDRLTATLRISGTFAEGDGIRTNAAQISLTEQLDEAVVFNLASSDPSEIQVPATLAMPAGASNIQFNLTVVDDAIADGAQSVTVTSSALGLADLTDSVPVVDNDPHHFEFTSMAPVQKTVRMPFPVTLRAADASRVTLAAFKGYADLSAENATGPLLVLPTRVGPFTNGLWSGLATVYQTGNDVQLAARAGDAEGASGQFQVLSGPFHHFAWDPLPAAAHAGAWLPVRLTACDSNGFAVTSFTGPVPLSGTRHAAGNPVRLLTFTRYADAVDYPNTMAAISNHFTDFIETPITTLDETELETELGRNDVFLIVAQDEADPLTLGTLGSAWAKALQKFVADGGVLIVCSGRNDEHRLLANANLLQLERFSYGWETTPLKRWMSSPLTAGVASLFDGRNVGTFYESAAYMHIATLNDGAAVAVTHAYGAGTIVVFACDFSVIGTDLDRVLANAVRLGTQRVAEPVAMHPVTATPFTDGVWTGIVSVWEAGFDLQFSATDGTGQTNQSSRFDAGPLLLAPMERTPAGELILRWNSDGVTCYTIEGSTSLLPGSFVPVITNLLATPPANGHIEPANGTSPRFYRLRVDHP